MDNILVYDNGELELKVSVEEETVWLTQKQLAELFDVTKQNISLHIRKIFKDEELQEDATVKFFLTVQKEGSRSVERNLEHYNLDMIISIGYKVNSIKATKFRQWATRVLKSYIQDGYVVNQHKINEKRFALLEEDVKNIKSHMQNNTLEIKQGIFFDGEIFDAYVFVSNLIRQAEKSIVLVDNYIDDTVLTMMSKNKNVNIVIYTNNISKQINLDMKKYKQQYDNLEIKKTNSYHDRFLILDAKEIYHIGASLKDLGKKVFAFSKIDITSEYILKEL